MSASWIGGQNSFRPSDDLQMSRHRVAYVSLWRETAEFPGVVFAGDCWKVPTVCWDVRRREPPTAHRIVERSTACGAGWKLGGRTALQVSRGVHSLPWLQRSPSVSMRDASTFRIGT
jgi:hypothetical protein